MSTLKVGGSTDIDGDGLGIGDKLAVIVRATVRATEDVATATSGTQHVVKLRMDTAIIASGAEAEKLQGRLAEVADEASGQSNLLRDNGEDYTTWKGDQLRAELKARKASTVGAKSDLVQRLRDLDAAAEKAEAEG